METLIIIGAGGAERGRLEQILSSADWRCLMADNVQQALSFAALSDVVVGFVHCDMPEDDAAQIQSRAPDMQYILYGESAHAEELFARLGDRVAAHVQSDAPEWAITLSARRGLERGRESKNTATNLVGQSYQNLFHASIELASAESLKQLLSLLCQEIARNTRHRRAIIVLGDSRFRIQEIGAFADDTLILPDFSSLRGRPLTPLLPGRIFSETGKGFVEQRSENTDESKFLIVPLERSDGAVTGFLTLDSPFESDLPLADLSESVALFLRHGVQAIDVQSLRGELRRQTESADSPSGARALELRQAQERFSRLVNLTDDVVYLCDDLSRIVYLNESFAHQLGYARENVLGKSLVEALTDIAVENTSNLALLEQISDRSADRVTGELELFAKDGNRRQFTLVHNWIRQGDEIVAAQGVLRDAGDRQDLVKRLAASERHALAGRLASGIAHEINNPLQAISSHLTGLSDRVATDEKASESISIVADSVNRIRVIVRSLLDLHRIEPAPRTPTQLNDVVARTIALLEPQMRQSGVIIEERLAPELPLVMAASTEIEQVLINLMLNASQAMTAGGTIVLESSSTNSRVELRVLDNGPGIAPEIQKRLFEPFATFREQGGGTGLGLYVSRFLITQHGGELRFESDPGKGTTFTISLPR